MKKSMRENGITLIALVITIIVLLILIFRKYFLYIYVVISYFVHNYVLLCRIVTSEHTIIFAQSIV